MVSHELPSVNARAWQLALALMQDAATLQIRVRLHPSGVRLVDAGVECPGSLEAGRRIAEISMGGFGHVTLQTGAQLHRWPWRLHVAADSVKLACLASQLAAWRLTDSAADYHAIGSGPARARAATEDIFRLISYRDSADCAVLVLEAETLPTDPVIAEILRDCQVDPERLVLIVAPITSLAGNLQVAARILSIALVKINALHFPLEQIVDGLGSAPLPPPSPDPVVAMGRTNDALLYGGQVHLFCHGTDEVLEALAYQLPSTFSPDYGKPFARIFADSGEKFYKVDMNLFAPGRVIVSNLSTGRSFHAGAFNEFLLDETFEAGRLRGNPDHRPWEGEKPA